MRLREKSLHPTGLHRSRTKRNYRIKSRQIGTSIKKQGLLVEEEVGLNSSGERDEAGDKQM
ncbi:hypothetical protein COLO4_01730 [Corchorus olitorius]|uniref:Uncharacterized protein n=1 Tax=Corchorus olitorius TaxID=93759 RepID=A0A1R3L226_9ROSI|nr:hypothetical protein COLO4_01730 [Corchorus olitorius]